MEGTDRNGTPASPHEISRSLRPESSGSSSSSLLGPLLRPDLQASLAQYDDLLIALLRRDARARSPPTSASAAAVSNEQASSVLRGLILHNELRQAQARAQAQAQAQATNSQRLLIAFAQLMAMQAPSNVPTGAGGVIPSAVARQLQSTPSLSASSSIAGARDATVPVDVISIPASSAVRELDSQASSLATEESVPATRGGRTFRRPRTMANSRDLDSLSEYQCLLREQMEFFEATPDDTKVTAQGRNKPIFLGQVGIQCKHCAHLPPKQRRRGAVYYPARLESIYQSAQNMGTNHFNGRCPNIPRAVGDHLGMLKIKKSFNHGGGKIYWADKAATAGVTELDVGLVFG